MDKRLEKQVKDTLHQDFYKPSEREKIIKAVSEKPVYPKEQERLTEIVKEKQRVQNW